MAYNKTYPARSPKRRIEKVYSQVVNTVTNSTTNVVLHTAEDAKTLVRIIMQGTWTPIDGGAVGWSVAIEPSGTAIVAPTTGSSLDQDVNQLQLLRGCLGWGSTSLENNQVNVDSSGMRKLQPGDEIVFRHVGETATMGTFSGSFLMIFKE